MRFKQLLIVCAAFCLPYSVMAWGMQGHRIVAQIADTYLTPKAKMEIKKILGDRTLAIESNWPDFIKSDTSYNYLSTWHYADLEPNWTEAQVNNYFKADTAVDAYTKLNFLIKELKNKNLPKEKQLMYLRLLVHIIGDVHQPMHVSHSEDLGGNKIKVTWFNEPSNLHRVWDESLINYQQLSYTEYANVINHPTAAQKSAWAKTPMVTWFYESYCISEKLYAEITKPDQKLSYRYNFDHIDTVNEQLLKGGIRLAEVLNTIFG